MHVSRHRIQTKMTVRVDLKGLCLQVFWGGDLPTELTISYGGYFSRPFWRTALNLMPVSNVRKEKNVWWFYEPFSPHDDPKFSLSLAGGESKMVKVKLMRGRKEIAKTKISIGQL